MTPADRVTVAESALRHMYQLALDKSHQERLTNDDIQYLLAEIESRGWNFLIEWRKLHETD